MEKEENYLKTYLTKSELDMLHQLQYKYKYKYK